MSTITVQRFIVGFVLAGVLCVSCLISAVLGARRYESLHPGPQAQHQPMDSWVVVDGDRNYVFVPGPVDEPLLLSENNSETWIVLPEGVIDDLALPYPDNNQ